MTSPRPQYDHTSIEPKWQHAWREGNIYHTDETSDKPKCYVLDMFPYPSGEGLHVGHPKGYIATDIYSRYMKMRGHNVLHPMGWDAFGLPAENYAIKHKIHPKIAVDKNIARYKEQLDILGLNYDWSREINTTDPEYYRWTQWIFLQLFKKGLAYESHEPINWCPSCKTGLANEDLDGDRCERCGTKVEKKPIRQWVLRITDYAERLLTDLDKLDWSDSIKELQRNWIGKSEGALVRFPIVVGHANAAASDAIEVFTTRVDTIFSGTYVIVAPEHPCITKYASVITNINEVRAYTQAAAAKAEADRTDHTNKSGIELKGITVTNPATGDVLPVWCSDFVLGHYGTGAVFADAHDARDFAMAKAYGIPLKTSVLPVDQSDAILIQNIKNLTTCYESDGVLYNSGQFDGMTSTEARTKITAWLGSKGFATTTTKYKLRDWVFSRQRYWGEPIPLIHCAKCGVVAVPESELPVKLPEIESYEPSGTGESPLATITSWVNTTCPTCKDPAKRETNTMPQWAGSSWYYLRYIDPHNTTALVDTTKEKYWSPVNFYVGGAEHATRHLIYARFWHKFLYDIGAVSYDEPFTKLKNQGLIFGAGGKKMSKSLGNVVNPDSIVQQYGADTFRLYEMFLGPFEQSAAWNTEGILGPRRFLERVWRLADKVTVDTSATLTPSAIVTLNKTIKKVTEDTEEFHFNTAISSLMVLINELEKETAIPRANYESMLKLITPYAPHIAEELWHAVGNTSHIYTTDWPTFDSSKLLEDTVTIVVQVQGKMRASFSIQRGATESEVTQTALAHPDVLKWLTGKKPSKMIYIPNKILNIVV